MPQQVWILGSAVIDHVNQVPRLPRSGESVFVTQISQFLGGKGSNQAVAAARSGASANIIITLADDTGGEQFLQCYKQEGLGVNGVRLDPTTQTGSAQVLVDAEGHNMIAFYPGANTALTAQDVLTQPIQPEDWVLTQFEIPDEALTATAQRGKLILNPAPMRDFPREILERTEIITPNETECEALTGTAPHDLDSAARAGHHLLALGPKEAIITLGASGALWMSRDGIEVNTATFLSAPVNFSFPNGESITLSAPEPIPFAHPNRPDYCSAIHFPAPIVTAIDSTGAGDVFNGTLVSLLSQNHSLPIAIQSAILAASASVTQPGAIPSIPRR